MAFESRTRSWLSLLALTLGWVAATPALSQNQTVAMTGGMGSKALLVINGGRPKAMSAGDEHQGVKVLSVGKEQAVVEIGGKRQTVLLGGAPVSLGGGGSGGGGSQISLTATEGGHFRTQGSINGRMVDFMVDTGATVVSLGADEAQRIGLKYEHGEKVMTSTANGRAMGYLVRLRSVRIQDVEVFDVQAIVGAAPMPFVLLGNSFLTRFQMKRENDQLTLTKRF